MGFTKIIVTYHVLYESIPDRCFELERELNKLSSDEERKTFVEEKVLVADVVEKDSDLYNEIKKRKAIKSNIHRFRADENNLYIIKLERYENNKGKIEKIGRLVTILRRDSFEKESKITIREWLGEDHPLVVLKNLMRN